MHRPTCPHRTTSAASGRLPTRAEPVKPASGNVNSPQTRSDPAALVRLAALLYTGLFGVAWLMASFFERPLLFRGAAAEAAGVDWPADVGVGLAAAALTIGLSLLLERYTALGRSLADALAALLGPLRTSHCLLLAGFSGVAEEALFRGALQPQLGLLLASLVFGLAHFAPRRELWPWTLFSFAAGLMLGALYEWTGNLVAPVVAHVGINAVNLRRLALRAGAQR